ncbi:MAG: hypothetical protein PF638_14880 [Candidatus Delongbacteria bacterium]|jgi:hypothetical protein|nr:hypothetical protein [Candidatus Delongbacteria bacterium]
MKYLFFGGAPNTGKSESILKLAKKMRDEFDYKEIYKVIPERGDFQCILEKANIKVLIQSDTDTPGCIKKLKKFYSENTDIYLIITSIRDIVDPMRNLLKKEMNISNEDYTFEIPLGRVTRRWNKRVNCISWYLDSVQKLAIEVVESKPLSI